MSKHILWEEIFADGSSKLYTNDGELLKVAPAGTYYKLKWTPDMQWMARMYELSDAEYAAEMERYGRKL